MKMFIILAMLIALGACSNSDELTSCKGPAFALNAEHWAPSSADLQMPKPGKTE